MEIAVVVSSTTNPYYLDFYPLVRRVWADLLGYRCVLAIVADAIPERLAQFSEDLLLFPPMDGIDDVLQSQCIRLIAPQLLTADTVLISDIDIIPICKSYFSRPLDCLGDSFVVYRDGVLDHELQIPICYNAASPSTWRDLVGSTANSIESAQLILGNLLLKQQKGGETLDWTTDQKLLYSLLSSFDNTRVLRIKDEDLQFTRLDRLDIKESGLTKAQLWKIDRGLYCDYHMLRPMSVASTINNLIADRVGSRRTLPAWARAVLRTATPRRYFEGAKRRLDRLFSFVLRQ